MGRATWLSAPTQARAENALCVQGPTGAAAPQAAPAGRAAEGTKAGRSSHTLKGLSGHMKSRGLCPTPLPPLPPASPPPHTSQAFILQVPTNPAHFPVFYTTSTPSQGRGRTVFYYFKRSYFGHMLKIFFFPFCDN